jgi:hypothetical protein
MTSPEATCADNALSQRRSTANISASAHTVIAPTILKKSLKNLALRRLRPRLSVGADVGSSSFLFSVC